MSRIDLAERIIAERFRTARFAAGYDLDQVDQLLDSLAQGVRTGTDPAELERLIKGTKFSETRWRSGYVAPEVDSFLKQLIRELRALPHSPAR